MKTSAQTVINELSTVAVVMDKDSESETSFQRAAERDLQAKTLRRRNLTANQFPAYCNRLHMYCFKRLNLSHAGTPLKPSLVWGLGDDVRRISSTI